MINEVEEATDEKKKEQMKPVLDEALSNKDAQPPVKDNIHEDYLNVDVVDQLPKD